MYSEEGLHVRINSRLRSNNQKTANSLNDVPWQVRAPDHEKQYSIRIFPPGAVAAGRTPHIFYDMPYSFTYKKPEWLEGHPKQETIEGYVKKRKDRIIESAMWYARQDEEFSQSLLPLAREITIERVVFDKYEGILIKDWAYTGGAHGNTRYAAYNLRNGKDVSLTEYLSDRGYSEEQALELLNKKNKYSGISSFNDFKNGQGRVWQVHPPDSENPIGIRLTLPGRSEAEGTITYTF